MAQPIQTNAPSKAAVKSMAMNTALRKAGGVAKDVGRSLLTGPIRVGASLVELPHDIRTQQAWPPFNVPFIGPVSTYQREAVDRSNQLGNTRLGTAAGIVSAGSKAILDTALLGGAANQIFNPAGRTTALSKAVSKVSPNAGSWLDRMTYRPFGPGSPQGWQLRLSQALNLPFWGMGGL